MLSAPLAGKFSRFLYFILLLTIACSIPSNTWAMGEKVDMPIGSVGGNVRSDLFTGTATTSIPIAVPPGRKGIQPQLALIYGSANGNGWVGMGWKLEKSVIDRQTKFGLDYNGDDFRVSLSGINADLVNVGADEYRAKIEGSFTRVKKLTAGDGQPYFEATDKTGTKYLFGQVAATRMADPGDPSRIVRWCLDRVEDVHGNYMTITYTLDQNHGYLSKIEYTGNSVLGLLPTHSVEFHLEDRADAPPLYFTKYLTKVAKRLKTIEIRANGNLVRAYKLTYTTSASTQRSLLNTVQQFGKDATIDGNNTVTGGTSLPPVTLGYRTDADSTFAFSDISGKPYLYNAWQDGYYYPPLSGDWNGDGQTDMIQMLAQDSTLNWVGLSNGDGTFTFSTLVGKPNNFNAHQDGYYYPPFTGDFNGDGLTDLALVGPQADAGWVGLSNGDGTFTFTINTPFTGKPNMFNAHQDGYYYPPFTGDFNGDGLTDLAQVIPQADAGWMGLANGDGTFTFTINTPFIGKPNHFNAHQDGYYNSPIMGDWNGDGNTDFVQIIPNYGSNWMALSNGDGTFSFSNSLPATTIAGNSYLDSGNKRINVGDWNGDGLMDMLHLHPNADPVYSWVALSNGDGTFNFQKSLPGASTATKSYIDSGNKDIYVGDWNGDGLTDLLHPHPDSNPLHSWVALSNGDGTFTFTNSLPGASIATNSHMSSGFKEVYIGDWDGNGLTDMLHTHPFSDPQYSWTALANGEVPDLLTSMSNGYGGSATIAYRPSTDYANTLLPYVVQTVKTITTDDGNGNVATSTYEFAGGYHHIVDREFRGFNYAKVTGPIGPNGEQAIEETRFHQGNETAVDVIDPGAPDGYLKGAVYRKRVKDASGNLFTETLTTYTPDADGVAPFYTPPAQVVTDICNGNTCTVQTRTDFTYDFYGNVIQEDQHKEVGEPSDDLTIVRTFSPNTTDWILGLPTSETIYEGIGTSGTQMTRTDFYYDGTTSCDVASTNQLPDKGLLTRTVKWLSASADPETRIAYDDFGNPVCSKNANGNTTSMTYDSEGFFETTFTDSLGFVTTTQYYGVGGVAADNGIYGQVKQVTDPNGANVLTAYDALGRVISVTQPDGFVTTTSYNNFGTIGTQHVKSDSTLGLSTWSYFDGLGRKILAKGTGTDSKIIVSETEYDVRGAVKRSSTPYFEVGGTPLYTTVTYDTVGRVLQTTNPDGSRTLTCYEDWVQVSVNANDQKKRVVQDADGRAIAVQEYEGTHTTCDTGVGTTYSTTQYQYDVLGNLRFVTDTESNQSEMRYDELSRKVFMDDPDMGQWTYAYDTVGNLILQTDAKSQQIHFQYDALNRQVQKDFDTQKTLGSGDVVYTFDGATSNGIGRLTNVSDSSGTSTFFYDIAGRGIQTDKVIDGITYTTQSVYDGLGRITTLTYPDNSIVTHTYNGPQLESVQEGATTYVSYAGFNALGQPATVTYGNGVATTYTYDPQNFRLATLKTVKGTTTLQDLGYSFDPGGNVTAITNPIHGNQAFVYDDLNRLLSATGMTASPSTFSYDKIGNMLSNSRIGNYNYADGAQTASVETQESNAYALWVPEEQIEIHDYNHWTLVKTSALTSTATLLSNVALAQTSGTVVFEDNFTNGADWDDLTTIAPDTAGISWLGLANSTTVDAYVRQPDAVVAGYYVDDGGYTYGANYGTVNSADVDIEATVTSLDSNSEQPIWLIGRWADANNMFAVAITDNSTNKARLYKIVNGTATLLGTSSAIPADGNTVKLEMRGPAIKFYIQGVEEISVTEANDLTAAGKSGLGFGAVHSQFSTYDARNIRASSFKVTEYSTSTSPPASDNFSGSLALPGASGNLVDTNTGATKEVGEPDHGGDAGGKSVWWHWVATGNGTMTIDTLGSDFDTMLGVYTGSSVNALTTIAENDDAVPGSVSASAVSFSAVSGQTYHVYVDGYDGDSGSIHLNWQFTSSGSNPPAMASPTPGSTFAGTSETFTWNASGTTVDQWRLSAGSTVGGTEYYTATLTSATLSQAITTLPSDGSTVHVRLEYDIGGTWTPLDYTYTAYTAPPPSGNTVVFEDNFTNGADWDDLTTIAPDTAGISWLGLANSTTVDAYVRQPDAVVAGYYVDDGGYTYGANYGTVNSADVDIEATVNTLDSNSEQPIWLIGRWADANNMFAVAITDNSTNKARLYKIVNGTATLLGTSSAIPADGNTVKLEMRGPAIKFYIQGVEEISVTEANDLTAAGKSGLGYGAIHSQFSTYDARNIRASSFKVTEIDVSGGTPPVMASPAAGSTFTGTSQTFTWNANGTTVDQWRLSAGSTVGGTDYYTATLPSATLSQPITTLPSDGSTVHVRLEYDIGGTWTPLDYTYTAYTVPPPPPPSGNTVVFEDNFTNGADWDDLTTIAPDTAGISWLGLANNTTVEAYVRQPDAVVAGYYVDDGGYTYGANYGTVNSADVDIEATVTSLDSNSEIPIWLIGRWADANNMFAVAITDNSTNKARLYKIVNGTATLLGTSSAIPADGNTVKLEMRGPAIKFYIQGVEEISVTEANDLTAAGKSGLGFGAVHSQFSTYDARNIRASSFKVTEYSTSTSPPASDNFSGSLALPGASGNLVDTNTGATKEVGEPDHGGDAGGKSVWWHWVATGNGTMTIDTLGSDFDTMLGVYTGSSVNALTTIAENDDAVPGSVSASAVSFSAVSGQTYHVYVDGYDGDSGSINLNWQFAGSGGGSTVTVPSVVGLTQAAATTAITGAGLVLGTVTNQSSATVASGDVISQNPASGTSVATSSAVDIVVSTGPTVVAGGGGPHAVKVAGSFIYGYDANGNMTSGGGRTIGYDFENRPTSITSGGTTTTMVYDGDGGRVKKTAGTATTVYIGKLYVCDNGSCTKMIFAGSQRVAQKEVGGATSYYHADHLGSTSVITDGSGVNVEDLAYYPYGDTFLDVGSKNVKFKYTGQEKDDSTGLYFYQARYYDAFLGRFIQADTIVPDPLDPQALNRYSYVLNNPILYTDPSGHFSFVAFAIGAAISAITTAVQGGSIGDIFTSAIIGGAAAGVGFDAFSYVSKAAEVSVNAVGAGIIGGIAGGAVGGLTAAVGYKAAGYDVDIGKGVGLGALAGGLTGGIGRIEGIPWAADILASGLVGGGVSELAGGDFATGFAFAAVTSASFHAYTKAAEWYWDDFKAGDKIPLGKGKNTPLDQRKFKSIDHNNIGKDAPGNGQVMGDFSKRANSVPLINATGNFHDPVMSFLIRHVPFDLVNYPTMLPAFAVTLGTASRELGLSNQFIVQEGIRRENEDEN
jgi:RHS repeat-associated protein